MLVTTPSRPGKTRAVPSRTRAPSGLADPIPTRWAVAGIIALVGANVAGAVLEPLPADPGLPDPWFVTLPNMVAVLAMLAALGGLLARQRWGMATSSLAGAISVVMVLACPLSGHHHFGMWWVGEIACVAAWTGISLAGLRNAPNRRALELRDRAA
jgi:hypothetical protein